MEKKTLLLLIVTLILSGCSYQSEKSTINQEGGDYMEWENPYFMKICSQVFEKPGNQITYEEVSRIENIEYGTIDNSLKAYVYLLDISEPKVVDEPKLTKKSLKDLAHFTNLTQFDLCDDEFVGADIFKDMPNLKELRLWGSIREQLLVELSESPYIESIKIPLLAIDYSSLAKIPNLKTVIITDLKRDSSNEFQYLLSLPSENCLIDLEDFRYEKLTPELYQFLSTHANVSKLGSLSNNAGFDLGFFEHMKDLTALDIADVDVDISGIAKMTWLKELHIRGSFDPSQLSGLINLEYLGVGIGIEEEMNLDFLSKMKNLRELQLSGKFIPSLKGVEALTELTSLTCTGSLLEDISALSRLHQLEYLELKYNLISDITALGSLTKLKHVLLDSNEISDLTPLKNCVNLEFLCLDGNFISDIRPLANLQKLEELQIQINDADTEANIDFVSWRKTLLTLPSLKFYVDGNMNGEWLNQYLPNVTHGRSEMIWSY